MFDVEAKGQQGSHEFYQSMARQIKAVTESEPDLIANLANISAILNDFLMDINWVGFYLTQASIQGQELVLGPFQGKVACVRIPFGQGVCGTAAQTQAVQRVEDVDAFEGHIACDSASRSEIVFPIIKDNEVVAVLDIDSPLLNRFSQADQVGLSLLIPIIEALNW